MAILLQTALGPARRLGLLSLAGLVVVLPLAHLAAWRSLFFLGVVLCSLWCLRHEEGSKWKLPPLAWVFLLWMLAAFSSLPDGPGRAEIFQLALQEVGKSTLLFYCAYLLSLGVGSVVMIYWGVVVALALLSGVVLVSWGIHGGWVSHGVVPALGEYATSALTLLPIVALPFFKPWQKLLGPWAKPFAVLSMLLALGGGALTMSRSVWLVVGAMQAVVFAVWYGRQVNDWRRGGALALIAGGVLLAIAWLVAQWRGMDLLYFSPRMAIYGPVFEHILESPWTGFGYGHESARVWYQQHMQEPGISHAHNIILSYAEQMGVLGVITIFAIFGGLFHRFFKGLELSDSRALAPAILGVALIVGIFIKNNLDIFFVRHNLLLFFTCTGMLLGLLEGDGARPRHLSEEQFR